MPPMPPMPPIPQQQPAAAPLIPQKTGPAPPVRFGPPAANKLVPQRTGRANLAAASKFLFLSFFPTIDVGTNLSAAPSNPFGF